MLKITHLNNLPLPQKRSILVILTTPLELTMFLNYIQFNLNINRTFGILYFYILITFHLLIVCYIVLLFHCRSMIIMPTITAPSGNYANFNMLISIPAVPLMIITLPPTFMLNSSSNTKNNQTSAPSFMAAAAVIIL